MSTTATVCDLRNARNVFETSRTIAAMKRQAHKRRRAAWRRWIQLGSEAREPTPRPLTGWDIS